MNILFRDHYGNSQLSTRQILQDPELFLAFGFGAGLFRFMPGTFGTAAAIPLYWGLAQTGNVVYLVATLAAIALGVRLCDRAAAKLQVHDFGGIVWDEIAGFLVTMLGVALSWQSLLVGFVLFRLLDILKPWPIKWLDRNVDGGLGIMLDDIAAGAIACLILHYWF
ncbi:phosphatidylglycerophosphatase A [Methylomonas sp. EFPC3]|uniref:phosphatidylglycerophosphatase A family protein n=1 Tax=Methylomonas sp. EFPC3 TaxID=3021710 RepID=UPI0024163894|nr:phosphatidylglycerophosphatase A [Methylomonas sp. EFPC3]WFP51282.1 phosphatidylglycerophosphatase A [Methylomonas sp. EFPC3]